MEPLHVIEYDLTSELAKEIHDNLVRWDLRRGWRRDLPILLCALTFGALVIVLGLQGWVQPGIAGGILCVPALFVIGAVYRRWSGVYTAGLIAVLALGTSDRRVRIEFTDKRARIETEFFRGEGAWTELQEVVVFSDFWLLRFTNSGQIVLPAAKMSPDVEAFLRTQAQEMQAPILEA
jgi:hypothetical protein